MHWNKLLNLCGRKRMAVKLNIMNRDCSSLHTRARVSKLTTSHISIHSRPVIMAHCSPVSIQTHFHSTIHASGAIPQSDTAMSAPCKIQMRSLFVKVVRRICDFATYGAHTALQHPWSGYSLIFGCHRGSQLVWIHIQCKQHHLEL